MWAEACKKASLKDPPCSWFIVTHTLKCFTVTWPQCLQCFLSVSPHQARAQAAKTVHILSGVQQFGLKLDQRHSILRPQTVLLSSFFSSLVSNIIKSRAKKSFMLLSYCLISWSMLRVSFVLFLHSSLRRSGWDLMEVVFSACRCLDVP